MKTKNKSVSHYNDNEKIVTYVIDGIEKQLNEILTGTEEQVIDKAHELIVGIDVPYKKTKLDKRFPFSLPELYEYFIIKDPERLIAILKKLLKVEQVVYDIDLIVATHFVYLINKSLEPYFETCNNLKSI